MFPVIEANEYLFSYPPILSLLKKKEKAGVRVHEQAMVPDLQVRSGPESMIQLLEESIYE